MLTRLLPSRMIKYFMLYIKWWDPTLFFVLTMSCVILSCTLLLNVVYAKLVKLNMIKYVYSVLLVFVTLLEETRCN